MAKNLATIVCDCMRLYAIATIENPFKGPETSGFGATKRINARVVELAATLDLGFCVKIDATIVHNSLQADYARRQTAGWQIYGN